MVGDLGGSLCFACGCDKPAVHMVVRLVVALKPCFNGKDMVLSYERSWI